MVSTERTAVCRKPDELRLLKMASTSGSTAAASTSSEKSYPSSTGSCGTACTIVDGVPNSSSRVPRRVFSTRGRDRPGAPAAGERGAGPVSRAKLKTVKLTAAVVLSYFVCWSPFFITQLWSVWDNEAPYQGTIIKKNYLIATLGETCPEMAYFKSQLILYRSPDGRIVQTVSYTSVCISLYFIGFYVRYARRLLGVVCLN